MSAISNVVMSGRKLDEKGVNEFGVQFCECKPHGAPHPYEPGEWCSPTLVIPKSAQPLADPESEPTDGE